MRGTLFIWYVILCSTKRYEQITLIIIRLKLFHANKTESWISGDAWIYCACITHICCCYWTGIRFICFLLCHHINIDMAFWTFQYFNRFHIVDVCNSSGLCARSMVLIPMKYCVIHYDTVQICCSHIITESNWDNGKNSISIELYCLEVRQSFKWKYLFLYSPCRCNLMWFKTAYNKTEIQKKTANNEKKLTVVCWCWSIWNGSCAQAEHFFVLRHSFWWCENFWFFFFLEFSLSLPFLSFVHFVFEKLW